MSTELAKPITAADIMPPLPPWGEMTPGLLRAYMYAAAKYRIIHVSWALLIPIVLTLLGQQLYLQAALAVVCGMMGFGLNQPAEAQFAVRREHAQALNEKTPEPAIRKD